MQLILVGGFLGSGKTTAIQHAASCLVETRTKVLVIANDQGEQLVDTMFFRSHNIPVKEVTHGCFCCNFPDLKKIIDTLSESGLPQIIFAESVGSCTDLVATVVNPLLQLYQNQLEIVLCVFADAQLFLNYLQKDKSFFNDNVNYIYGKQLEEADLIIVNKIDLLNERELQSIKQSVENKYLARKVLFQNSLNKENIKCWLETIDNCENSKFRKTLQLDYSSYADGEAELGWLDAEIGIATEGQNAHRVALTFIENIYKNVCKENYVIGHLKFWIDDGYQQKKVSITAINQIDFEQGENDLESDRVMILMNARLQTKALNLHKIISNVILQTETLRACKITEGKFAAFQPGYPKPFIRIL